MSAEGFQWLYGKDVKKDIKEAKHARETVRPVIPLPPQTHTLVTGKGAIFKANALAQWETLTTEGGANRPTVSYEAMREGRQRTRGVKPYNN